MVVGGDKGATRASPSAAGFTFILSYREVDVRERRECSIVLDLHSLHEPEAEISPRFAVR